MKEQKNEMQIFENKEFGKVRIVEIDNEPWFVGKDVAIILGYSNPRDALSKRVDAEDKGVAKCDTLGGTQNLMIINESGLYSLILSSKLPNAKKFKHWVTNEVLPSIHKHGMYATDNVIDQILGNPDFGIQLLTELKNEREARKNAENTIEQQKPLVDFANQVSVSENYICMANLSKLLNNENINIGRNKLYAWLRNKGMLMSDNTPYQSFVERGYFVLKENTYKRNGRVFTNQTTYVTGKGQLYIAKKIKEEYAETAC